MTWFEITVEDANGIKGKHYVEAMYPSSAVESEQIAGLKVLRLREWSTSRFPNILRLIF